MGRRSCRSSLLAATVLLLLHMGMGPAAADPVLPVPETGGQGMLRLTSSVYPLNIPPLAAGETFSWQVGVVLDGPETASATIRVQGAGSLAEGPGAYSITARSCPQQWLGTSGRSASLRCPSAERRILAAGSFSSAGTLGYPLGSFTAADAPWVLFTLKAPPSASSGSEDLAFGIGVEAGGGDGPAAEPLADTGAGFLLLSVASGGVLVAAGATILLARRRRPS